MSNRTLNVVRLQFVNKQTFVWVPLLVLGGAILISYIIFAMIPIDQPKYGGGAQAPLWYFLVVGIQALTMTFPFSQAMSLTRREFYIGSLAAAAVTAAILSVVFVGLGLLEQATNGFGINGYFAYLPWLWEGGWAAALLEYFVIAMLFFIIGFWAATIYKRWGTFVTTAVMIGLGLLLLLAIFIITRMEAWPSVWEWILDTGALGFALWGAVLAVVLAVGSYLSLRRSIP